MTTRAAVPRQWPGRAASTLLAAAATAASACALGAVLPVQGLRYSLMLGTWGMGVSTLLALLLAAALWLRRRHRTRARTTCAVLLAACLAVTTAVASAQVRQAHAHGTDLSWWQATGAGQWGELPDVEETYLDDAGTGQLLQAGVWLPRDAHGTTLTPAQARAVHPGGVPVVVLLHGGGWRTGNRRNPMTKGQATWLARQGYLAVSLDYPLSSPRLATWRAAGTRVACGLSWTGQNAARYGGDAGRLALVGDSAGGHLALETVTRQALGTLDSACGGTVPTVRALSLTYPVTDPVTFHDNPDWVMAPFTSSYTEMYLGGPPQAVRDRYEEVNPLRKVEALGRAGRGGALPPVVIVHGAQDHVVPVEGTLRLDAALRQAGADVTTVVMPYADHVWDLNAGSLTSQTWHHLTLQALARAGMPAPTASPGPS